MALRCAIVIKYISAPQICSHSCLSVRKTASLWWLSMMIPKILFVFTACFYFWNRQREQKRINIWYLWKKVNFPKCQTVSTRFHKHTIVISTLLLLSACFSENSHAIISCAAAFKGKNLVLQYTFYGEDLHNLERKLTGIAEKCSPKWYLVFVKYLTFL